MSALPPKAAAALADRRVRFGSKGDIGDPTSAPMRTNNLMKGG